MDKQAVWVCGFAAGALLLVAMSANLSAGQSNVENGKVVFEMCASCHTLDGSEGDGPTLQGVFGRKAGGVETYRYSAAMARSDIVWNEMTLNAFFTDPQAAIPGNRMAFAGIDDQTSRTDLIAYLAEATKKKE
jgi:cytochrome c